MIGDDPIEAAADWRASFADQGYAVVPALLAASDIVMARAAVDELVARHRGGDASVREASLSIGSAARHRPARNPGIVADDWQAEPYLIGDLLALDERCRRLLTTRSLWGTAATLLDCPFDDVVFHLSNVTRKPASIGPAISWHRDADNQYFAASDERTIRLLLPLQAMSAANGGTAIIAGSHRHDDASTSADPAAAICPAIHPGWALALHARVVHGGSTNRSARQRDVIVVQFGVRSSPLRCHATETGSLAAWRELRSGRVNDLGNWLRDAPRTT